MCLVKYCRCCLCDVVHEIKQYEVALRLTSVGDERGVEDGVSYSGQLCCRRHHSMVKHAMLQVWKDKKTSLPSWKAHAPDAMLLAAWHCWGRTSERADLPDNDDDIYVSSSCCSLPSSPFPCSCCCSSSCPEVISPPSSPLFAVAEACSACLTASRMPAHVA